MDLIKAKHMVDWVVLKLRIPWIGTSILIILGSLSTIFPFTLFYGVQFIAGSAAALIALRLHGTIYGFVTITFIYLLNTTVVGFEPRNLTVMIAPFH